MGCKSSAEAKPPATQPVAGPAKDDHHNNVATVLPLKDAPHSVSGTTAPSAIANKNTPPPAKDATVPPTASDASPPTSSCAPPPAAAPQGATTATTTTITPPLLSTEVNDPLQVLPPASPLPPPPAAGMDGDTVAVKRDDEVHLATFPLIDLGQPPVPSCSLSPPRSKRSSSPSCLPQAEGGADAPHHDQSLDGGLSHSQTRCGPRALAQTYTAMNTEPSRATTTTKKKQHDVEQLSSTVGTANHTKKKSVAFDRETMRKSAPKQMASSAQLTKKQQDLIKKNHVSTGRRGPVASRFEKGSRSQMQTDVYLQMANAFERLLTNAETINAQLDTR